MAVVYTVPLMVTARVLLSPRSTVPRNTRVLSLVMKSLPELPVSWVMPVMATVLPSPSWSILVSTLPSSVELPVFPAGSVTLAVTV